MKKIFTICVVLILVSVVFGCGVTNGKGDAEKVAQALLNERIEKGGFGSDSVYSDVFRKATTPEKWENIKKLVSAAMGNLKSYKLNTWKVTKQATSELSGTVVNLVYDTVYEKGNGVETLTLYRPVSGKAYLIISYYFNSPEIQKMIDEGVEKVVSSENRL
jgi:hypothetical protein